MSGKSLPELESVRASRSCKSARFDFRGADTVFIQSGHLCALDDERQRCVKRGRRDTCQSSVHGMRALQILQHEVLCAQILVREFDTEIAADRAGALPADLHGSHLIKR
jgi:hypothetical protein